MKSASGPGATLVGGIIAEQVPQLQEMELEWMDTGILDKGVRELSVFDGRKRPFVPIYAICLICPNPHGISISLTEPA